MSRLVMQKFDYWLELYAEETCRYDLNTSDLREAYEAGYEQRDKEINEHCRKVMEDEKSNEVGIPMSPVGD